MATSGDPGIGPGGDEAQAPGFPAGKAWLRVALLGLGACGLAGIGLIVVLRLTSTVPFEQQFPRRFVSLKEPEDAPQAHRPEDRSVEPTLRVAIAPVISPEKSLETYQELVRYLGARTDRRPVSLPRGTYADTNDLVRYGRCELAMVCSYAYIRGEREFGMEPIAVPRIDGEDTYRSYIIVGASDEHDSLLALRRRRFASADLMSTSGWLFPALCLKESGEDPSTFFSEHVITGSHDRSILAVSSGFVDGAAVDSLVYDRLAAESPALTARTRVILRSPPYGMPLFVSSPHAPAALKAALRQLLLGMHEDEDGRRILSTLHVDRFEAPVPERYDTLREAVRAWEKTP